MLDIYVDNQAPLEGNTPDTPDGNDTAEELLHSAEAQQLLNRVRQYMTPVEVEQVAVALRLAQKTCGGVLEHKEASLQTLQRIPPLEHALAIATILTEMHIDTIGVSAGLIFEAVDAERLPIEQVETILGTPVARVVSSMLRLNILERTKQARQFGELSGAQIHAPAGNEVEQKSDQKKRRIREVLRRQQAETVRKMFVGMAEDPRVVLLKLAYRLHAMRVVSAEPDRHAEQQELHLMAQETRDIYAPLAGRLGMSRAESELEDLAFAILEPDKYEWIRKQVETESKQWKAYVDRVCTILQDEMAAIGLKAEVSGRVKHYYSFYKKLQRSTSEIAPLDDLRSALDLSQIHDLIAFRILVESPSDCYLALGHVHSLWKPKDGRIKDFIANPKTNGYRALHTTVFCLDDQLVEIQIRTFAMHEMAEYGVAMHWHYKDVGDSASASAKELLSWLRQLTDWQRDLRSSNTSDSEFADAVKDDIFQEQIFVFTPRGEVKDLPVGSTPLDFAYRIHSKVGDRCAGARIIMENGTGDRLITRMVPLDYELKSGEIVDIVTNRTAHPTRDWLNFARTAAARSKIRRYLKTYERDINIQIGRERLDRELKTMGIARGVEIISEDIQKWLEEEYSGKTFEDILAAVGSDEIRPHGVAVKIHERYQQREGKETKEEETDGLKLSLQPTSAKATPPARLQVAGVNGLLTNLANCCCPLPGDEIVGFISRGKGAIIHRADCHNIDRYRERERERLITVSWVSMDQQRYLAPVLITAHDRSGLIRDIATVVSELNVNMTSVSSTVNANHEHVLISATLEVDGLDQLQRVFAKLEKVKNVLHVERDLGKKRRKSAS